jgi:hypothetical protein
LLKTCPYPAIFAPPPVEHAIQRFSQPPAPYVVEPDGWGEKTLHPGDSFHFDMVLMGRALSELALLVYAWQQAAGQGFGKFKGTAKLAGVDYLLPDGTSQAIYAEESGRLQDFSPMPLPVPEAKGLQAITLDFVSPLRLQENGHALPPEKLQPSALLMAAVRRAALICGFYGAGAPDWDFSALSTLAEHIAGEKDLHWQDWTRYSNRQKQSMALGGVVGQWRLFGDLDAFFPALWLCQCLHVGKETVFGLGRFYIMECAGQLDFPHGQFHP